MVLSIRSVERMFSVPRVVFTLRGQKRSEGVINALMLLRKESSDEQQDYRIFDGVEEVRRYMDGGVAPSAAVAIFDGSGARCFKMMTNSRPDDQSQIPSWACNAHWAVNVHGIRSSYEGCARQIRSDFLKKFEDQLSRGQFPWGSPRKKETAPRYVTLSSEVDGIVKRLNDGPDLASIIAHTEHALDLPTGSRISWFRVAPEPIGLDEPYLTRIVFALRRFQVACNRLLHSHPEVASLVFAGVSMEEDQILRDAYLFPVATNFSIDRADLHYRGNGLFASEIDEMPGGFAELVHIDRVYGINQDRWTRCFDWLFSQGPVLFLVSSNWSRVYFPEIEWLVEYLCHQGYQAHFLPTDQLHELEVRPDGVWYKNNRLGTIWRQFPVFETTGKLKDLVIAAKEGVVRLVPEFAHFGNKAWFSVFRKYQDFFEKELDGETYGILKQVLPDSALILPQREGASFPCTVGGKTIEDFLELRRLPGPSRDALVLKVCGANTLAARSYGVLMGHGLSQELWEKWIDERIEKQQPFIVQSRVETAVARVVVKNTKLNYPELFSCRVLLRPWLVSNELVSVHACAVPSNTLRVHGRVDMAILPVKLEG